MNAPTLHVVEGGLCACGDPATRVVLVERHLPYQNSQFNACDRCADHMAWRSLERDEVASVETRPIEREGKR